MLKKTLAILFILSTFLFYPLNISADSTQTVTQNAVASTDLTTLVSALNKAELVDSLDQSGDITVLAPSNSAFLKLGDTLDVLLKNENKLLLQDILKYHVISGKFASSQISQLTSTNTSLGQNISISNTNGEIGLNGSARVISADIPASNGVIHIIDSVLLSNQLQLRLNLAISDSSGITSNESTNNNTTPRSGAGEVIMYFAIFAVLTISIFVSIKGSRGFLN